MGSCCMRTLRCLANNFTSQIHDHFVVLPEKIWSHVLPLDHWISTSLPSMGMGQAGLQAVLQALPSVGLSTGLQGNLTYCIVVT